MFGMFAKKNPYDAVIGAAKFNKTIASMAINSSEEILFDLEQQDHLTRINECTKAVNQHLPVLKNLDKHIAIGLGSAMGALLLSAVLPFGLTIAMTGVAYGAYFLGGRDEPFNQFNAALEELAHCCDWALSDLSNTKKLQNEDIKAMLKTLAPLVTKADLLVIMGDEKEADKVIKAIDDLNAQQLQEYNAAMQLEDAPQHLSKPVPVQLATKNDVHYTLYGYKQGGTFLTLANLTALSIQKVFTYLSNLMFGAATTTTNSSDNSDNASVATSTPSTPR